MVALFLKLQHTKSAPFVEQLKRIDWFGSVLFIASTTSVLIPISWGKKNLLFGCSETNLDTKGALSTLGQAGEHLSL
jgi:hypothetical protein